MSESTFDHVNLNEVDPSATPIELGDYTFQIGKMYKKSYDVKDKETQQPTGEKGSFYTLQLTIVDSDRYSGRSFFPAFFDNNGSAKQLRKISDAVGVQQQVAGREGLEQWFADLAGMRLRAPVQDNPKRVNPTTGKPERGPNMWEVAPA